MVSLPDFDISPVKRQLFLADIEPAAVESCQSQMAQEQSSANIEPATQEQSSADIEPTAVESCQSQMAQEPVNLRRGRKRTRSVKNWKRSLSKKHRNCGDEYVTSRGAVRARRRIKKGCGDGCRLRCHSRILPTERENIFHAFWQLGDVTRQREFIVKHCCKVGSRKMLGSSRRKFTLRYSFQLNGNAAGVCKQFFLDTLNINDRVVRTAFDKLTECGMVSGDNRGAVSGVVVLGVFGTEIYHIGNDSNYVLVKNGNTQKLIYVEALLFAVRCYA